jgi:hypothetical protein
MTADARDIEAWTRAIEMARLSDPARARQMDDMLKERHWEEVGRFAGYCMQGERLRLRPWATPPCALLEDVGVVLSRGDDGAHGNYAAAVLLRRLRVAGLSDWEPDPLAALREAEKPAA